MISEISHYSNSQETQFLRDKADVPSPAFYSAAIEKLFSTHCYLEGGTTTMNAFLWDLINEDNVSITPEQVISDIAHSEEIMDKAVSMWDSINSGDISNYPFILAMLHSQLPLSDMTHELFKKVKDLPNVNYAIDTFSPIPFCEKSEGYLADAISSNQVGGDGDVFLVKTSRAAFKNNKVGYTAGVSSKPALAQNLGREVVVVPYVWYRPAEQMTKDSISEQIQVDRTFSAPGSTWQVVRQFYGIDFSQVYGENLDEAQRAVFQHLS